jgi:hypothetical protein
MTLLMNIAIFEPPRLNEGPQRQELGSTLSVEGMTLLMNIAIFEPPRLNEGPQRHDNF